MGYRSEVFMIIKAEDDHPTAVQDLMALAEARNAFKGWDEDSYGWDETTFVFRADDVKWYVDVFEDVQAIEWIWEMANSMDSDSQLESKGKPFCGAFIRIGEDEADIEAKYIYDGWDLARVQRSYYCEIDAEDIFSKRVRKQALV